MGSQTDLSVLKDIPGYKAILKTVLKSQIQLLIEQLAENTGEESIILTASINDGSLSHLGSNMGKAFLDGKDEIKSQFLGFCLKEHHHMKSVEEPPYGRGSLMPQAGSSRRPRIRPHPYSMSPSNSHTSPGVRTATQDFPNSTPSFLKTEEGSCNSADNFLESVSSGNNMQDNHVNFPSSVNLSHTQTSTSQGETNDYNQSGLPGEKDNQSFSESEIKLEPNDLEDEVQIIEAGENSASSDNWGQGDPNESETSFNMTRNYRKVTSDSEFYSIHIYHQNNISSKVFKCNFCGKQALRKGDIERHVVKHTKMKPFTCSQCQKGFTRKQALLAHLFRLHPESVQGENYSSALDLSPMSMDNSFT